MHILRRSRLPPVISDYRDVDPVFGNLGGLDELTQGLHERGMKLMMDLVVNHTSDEHPWFAASRSSREDPKRDWYWWRDPRPGYRGGEPGGEPTTWESQPGGVRRPGRPCPHVGEMPGVTVTEATRFTDPGSRELDMVFRQPSPAADRASRPGRAGYATRLGVSDLAPRGPLDQRVTSTGRRWRRASRDTFDLIA